MFELAGDLRSRRLLGKAISQNVIRSSGCPSKGTGYLDRGQSNGQRSLHKHGAIVNRRKVKRSSCEGCGKLVKNNGVCRKHGAIVKRRKVGPRIGVETNNL